MSIGENIARFRKEKGWTQAELGERIGVSNQAISKWELGITMPDIMLLPILADTFCMYIDELFSRNVKAQRYNDFCAEFPWADDSVVRGVVCEGRKILQCTELVERFTFEIRGDAKNVQSECNIEVNGNISGGCKAGKNINVSGVVSGGCTSGAEVVIGGNLSGGVSSDGDITVGGSLSGGCNADGNITCGGNHTGDINCDGTVTVHGNVESVRIKGDVVCNALKCDKIEGDVVIKQVTE